LERLLNPRLNLANRESFIAHVGVAREKAPYFRRMEVMNLDGTPSACEPPATPSLPPGEFAGLAGDAMVVDTRCPSCFGAAHVPGALCIPLEEIPSYAGWYLPFDRPILLVTESGDAGRAARYLYRMGFDRIAGSLQGCVKAWHAAGLPSGSAGIVDPLAFAELLDNDRPWVLDVRSAGELESMPPVAGAHHIPIREVVGRTDEVPHDRPIYVVCATGTRAAIVSSVLLRAGVPDVSVVLGGMIGLTRARLR
jgi:hydroxyacylglutathione hydrolase